MECKSTACRSCQLTCRQNGHEGGDDNDCDDDDDGDYDGGDYDGDCGDGDSDSNGGDSRGGGYDAYGGAMTVLLFQFIPLLYISVI